MFIWIIRKAIWLVLEVSKSSGFLTGLSRSTEVFSYIYFFKLFLKMGFISSISVQVNLAIQVNVKKKTFNYNEAIFRVNLKERD